jgi:DNA-binding transcriptional LysR family regulator
MNLRQVEAFRAVMILKSVTKAAAAMHITQSAASKLLAQMERTTGLRLFKRAKNNLEPTPEALQLFLTVEHAFVGLDEIKMRANDIRNLHVGHLRIASVPPLAVQFLPRAIKRFSIDHPRVTFTLMTKSPANVEGWIASQQYDLGFASNFDGSAVRAEIFAAVEAVCIFPRGHKLEALKVVRPTDLVDVPLVSQDADSSEIRRRTDVIFQELKIPRRIVVETPSVVTVCNLVREGMGVAIVNRITAREFLHTDLVARRFRPLAQLRIMKIQPKQGTPSQLATHFFETMLRIRDEELSSTDWLMPGYGTANERSAGN